MQKSLWKFFHKLFQLLRSRRVVLRSYFHKLFQVFFFLSLLFLIKWYFILRVSFFTEGIWDISGMVYGNNNTKKRRILYRIDRKISDAGWLENLFIIRTFFSHWIQRTYILMRLSTKKIFPPATRIPQENMATLSKSFVILIFHRWITNYEARNPFLSPFYDTLLAGEKNFSRLRAQR